LDGDIEEESNAGQRQQEEEQGEKGRSLTEATASAPNVTECYILVRLHSLDGILRSGKILMVFSGDGDLSML
jgi:hypothetical protein